MATPTPTATSPMVETAAGEEMAAPVAGEAMVVEVGMEGMALLVAARWVRVGMPAVAQTVGPAQTEEPAGMVGMVERADSLLCLSLGTAPDRLRHRIGAARVEESAMP